MSRFCAEQDRVPGWPSRIECVTRSPHAFSRFTTKPARTVSSRAEFTPLSQDDRRLEAVGLMPGYPWLASRRRTRSNLTTVFTFSNQARGPMSLILVKTQEFGLESTWSGGSGSQRAAASPNRRGNPCAAHSLHNRAPCGLRRAVRHVMRDRRSGRPRGAAQLNASGRNSAIWGKTISRTTMMNIVRTNGSEPMMTSFMEPRSRTPWTT